MADIEGTQISDLPTKLKADVADIGAAWLPFEDENSSPVDAYKMSIEDLLDGVTGEADTAIIIYSPSHGLTSVAVGKPIGWRADGKPYVWSDTADTELPVAVCQAITDTDHVELSPIGAVAEIANTLLPASMPVYGGDTNSRLLCWDSSAAAYKHVTQDDSVRDLRLVYWIGLKEGAATTSVVLVIPGGLPGTTGEAIVANVRDFGAVPDGTTDCRTAIQAAIDSGRPIVYFPGDPDSTPYLVSDYLAITTAYQQLVGDGPSSVLHGDNEDSTVLYFYGTSASDRLVGCGVSKLWVQGANATIVSPTMPTGGANGVGIRVYYCHQFRLSDAIVSHCTGHGVHVYSCGSVAIEKNWFFNQYYSDGWEQNAEVYCNDDVESLVVRDNHFHSNIRLHIYTGGSQIGYQHIDGNVSFACDSDGNPLEPRHSEVTNSSDPYSIVKHNCALCYGTAFNTGFGGRAIVANNLFHGGRWTNLYYNSDLTAEDDIGMRLVVDGNIMSAGAWYNNEAYGATSLSAPICIHAGREVLITGNVLLDPKCHPLANPAIRVNMVQDQGFVQVTGNVLSNAFCGGIALSGKAARHVIRGNYLYNCGGRDLYPIHVTTSDSFVGAGTVSSINTSTGVFTCAAAHNLTDGDRVRFSMSAGTYFTVDGLPVDSLKIFYVRDKDATTFKISGTPDGTALDVTATFSGGTLTVTHVQYLGGNVVHDNVAICDVDRKYSDPIEFTAASVNTSTNRITLVNHGITGAATQKIVFDTDGTLFSIGGSPVTNGTVYYGRYVDADTFEVATTSGGSAADITAAGSGTHNVRMIADCPGGIYYYHANEAQPSSIRKNVLISHQPQPSSYGTWGYGIRYLGTGPKIIADNDVMGFLVGIDLPGSYSARTTDDVMLQGNFVRNAYYPYLVTGSVNGLVIVDDSNQTSGGIGNRVVQGSGYVGMHGSRRNGKVSASVPYLASVAITATSGNANLTVPSGHGYTAGVRVQLSGTVPTGFATSTNYWIVSAATTTVQLSATRGGSAITPSSTVSSGMLMTHQVPSFGTWAAGDVLVNESWTAAADPVDFFCVTAGAIGTCVFTARKMST